MLISAVFLIAASDMLKPPRDSGIRIMSSQSMVDLRACVTRQMIRDGQVATIAADGGVDLDYLRTNDRKNAQAARYSLHLREKGNLREISAFYRHPFSRRSAEQHTKIIAKRCFPSEYGVRPVREKKQRKKLLGIF